MGKFQGRFAALLVAVVLVGITTPAFISTASAVNTSPAHLVVAHTAATTKNANINGTWAISQGGKPLDGNFDITGEDTTTGSFGGRVNIPPSKAEYDYYDITDGQVTGNSFTITADYPGTVVDDNGLETTYAGTVDGSTMTGEETGLEAWKNGRKLSVSSVGDQTFTAKRDGFNVSGEIELGCQSGAGACPLNGTPFEGFEVDVTGDNGSATSTSDDEGKWNVDLPSGSYTITPTDSLFTFTPSEIHVDLTKTETDEDFKACAANSTASEDALVRHSSGAYVYDLTGTDQRCYATFHISYRSSPSPQGHTTIVWTTDALSCEIFGVKKSLDNLENPMKVAISFKKTTLTRDKAGVVVGVTINDPNSGSAEVNPVVKVTINKGYGSGTAVLNGKSFKKTTPVSSGFKECYPPSGSVGLSPTP